MFQIQTRLLPRPTYQMINLVCLWLWTIFERMVMYASVGYTLHEMYFVFRFPEMITYTKTQIMKLAPYEYQILQMVYLATTVIQCVCIILAAQQVARNIEDTQARRRKIMMESKPEPTGFENPIVY